VKVGERLADRRAAGSILGVEDDPGADPAAGLERQDIVRTALAACFQT
jgi:hypothetical protein